MRLRLLPVFSPLQVYPRQPDHFPIADYQGVGPFRQYRGVLER